jgi:hypothetical protein
MANLFSAAKRAKYCLIQNWGSYPLVGLSEVTATLSTPGLSVSISLPPEQPTKINNSIIRGGNHERIKLSEDFLEDFFIILLGHIN